MGNNNAGRRRREGRMAFSPGVDPDDINPYLRSSAWGSDMFAKDWYEGWVEARTAHEKELAAATADPADTNSYCPHCGGRL